MRTTLLFVIALFPAFSFSQVQRNIVSINNLGNQMVFVQDDNGNFQQQRRSANSNPVQRTSPRTNERLQYPINRQANPNPPVSQVQGNKLQNPPVNVMVNEDQGINAQQQIAFAEINVADNNVGENINLLVNQEKAPSQVSFSMPDIHVPAVRVSFSSSSEAKKHESLQRVYTRKAFNLRKKMRSVLPRKKRSINRTACFSWS